MPRAVFPPQQEICSMVTANNAIRLREIQSAILKDDGVFQNINSVSISTVDRLQKTSDDPETTLQGTI